MLIITRKKDQKVIIADDIEITVLEVGRNRVRFGINAPKNVSIHTHLKASPAANAPMQVANAPMQVMEAQAMAKEPKRQTPLPAVIQFSKRS